MRLLKINVRMNTEVTTEDLKNMNADAVILAIGSSPIMPRLPGIDHPKTASGVDVLLGRKQVGNKIVIVGGGLVGCEIAYGYLKEGKSVTIVEALDEIMKTGNVPGMNKSMLLDGFAYYGAEILVNTRLKEINDEGAVVTLPDGSEKTLQADNVIMSVGYRPLPSFAADLAGNGAQVFEIGDGHKVGNVLSCIHDAYQIARSL